MRSVSRPAALTFLITLMLMSAIAAVLACTPPARRAGVPGPDRAGAARRRRPGPDPRPRHPHQPDRGRRARRASAERPRMLVLRCRSRLPDAGGQPRQSTIVLTINGPCIPSLPSNHNDRHHTRPATHRRSSLPTPDHLAFLNAHDAQLQRSMAVSPVLKSRDRHLHSDADSHAARTMHPIRSTANARRSTIPHSRSHKSRHRACYSAIPYSERRVTGHHRDVPLTDPFVKVKRLFRHSFDDRKTLFVLPAPPTARYNDPFTNMRSYRCRFKKWAHHWA